LYPDGIYCNIKPSSTVTLRYKNINNICIDVFIYMYIYECKMVQNHLTLEAYVKCSQKTFASLSFSLSLYIYIYIYVCVCVCVRVCGQGGGKESNVGERTQGGIITRVYMYIYETPR
jgi:hypothetical protein